MKHSALVFVIMLMAGVIGNSVPAATVLQFTDITTSAGTAGPSYYGGHGAMWADVTGDGLSDCYVTMNFQPTNMGELFYRNTGGNVFVEEAASRGIDDFDTGSHGGVWADLDNDGDYDLVNGGFDRNRVWQNNGTGQFTERTATSGFMNVNYGTRGVVAFDYNNDGRLDILCNNWWVSGSGYSEPNEFYINNGGFSFTPANNGLANLPSCQGVTAGDYDNDGDADIVLCRWDGNLTLMRNDGGQFTQVVRPEFSVTGSRQEGATFVDVNNDGWLDLHVQEGQGSSWLFTNNKNGTFTQRSVPSGPGFMAGFEDLNNDGKWDMVYAGDTKVYYGDGAGNFTASDTFNPGGINDPRAVAFADIDNDGDMDFFYAQKRTYNRLIRNDLSGTGTNWLRIKLVSADGQAGAFGAKVKIYEAGQAGTPASMIAFRQASSQEGYLGQNDPVMHFGLGIRTTVDVQVTFHGGAIVSRSHVAAGQILTVNAEEAGMYRTAQQWTPTEFEVNNPTYSGNPFDLIASATFVHGQSAETRTTGMFYAGGTTWKFRFTGTRPGLWSFSTSSADSDLNGLQGTVMVEPAPSGKRGFVSHVGNRWVRAKGPDGTAEAFVPQYVMYAAPKSYYNNPAEIDADIQAFFVQHGFNGFHTYLACYWFDLYNDASYNIPSMDPNPDFRTFEALELLFSKVHAAGGVVHLWSWGDDSRSTTPTKWGINGTVDKRLQRYIAARLGPLPGWTMGYGFDLWEWVTGSQLTEWHDYLHQYFGWPHMLGGRNFQGNVWVQLSEALDYSSYEQWRPDYNMYVLTMEDRPTKPSFSEDRFRIRNPSPYPEKDYTEEMTRRGLWHSTMAGGVANIWGNLVNSPSDGSSAPYPHPYWIRTYADFFKDRFLLSMVRDNALTNGVCLRTPDSRLLLFYRESINSISMNLSGMPSAQPAVAVDALQPYQEISLGVLQPGQQTWTAPYSSDWAIAVGIPPVLNPVSNLQAVASDGQVALSWTNPTATFAGVKVVFKTTGYPTSYTDGAVIYDGLGTSHIHAGLTNGITYYYAVYTYESGGGHSSPSLISGLPQVLVEFVNEIFDPYQDADLGSQGTWAKIAMADAKVVSSGLPQGREGKAALMDTVPTGVALANRISFIARTSGLYTISFDMAIDGGTGTAGELIGYVSVYGTNSLTEIARAHLVKSRVLLEHASGTAILSSSAANNTWYAVKLEFDIGARNMKAYFNGASKGTYNWKGTASNLSHITISSDRNTDLAVQKAWIDNLKLEPTPGQVSEVRDDGGYSPSVSRLHFNFDPVADAFGYRYAIGTSSGGVQVRNWTEIGGATDYTATGLSLAEGTTNYYVSVQCANLMGTWGAGRSSNGIKVAPGVATIPAAKALADGQSFEAKSLRNKVVTHIGSGFFYIQEPNRPFGLKVVSSASVSVGNEVDVAGPMKGAGSERYLDATGNGVMVVSSGAASGPVAFSNATLGGRALNTYTPGVVNGLGVHNIGTYVTVYGKVTQRDPSSQYFYVDDGSGIRDGTQTEGSDNMGVRIPADPGLYSVGSYLVVTGISSCFDSGGLRPLVLPTSIQTLLAP